MKTIHTEAIIEGIRARKDGSLGLTITTPELNTTEKALFMDLQGIVVGLSVTPQEERVEEVKIDKDVNQKSQSVRIRSVLYILWSKDNEGMEYEAYYRQKTEKYIEFLKGKVDE